MTARTHIRDAALALFAERGFDAVTVRQIAAAAGVSAGLVVHHFGSKQGLREVVDEYVSSIVDELLAALEADPAAALAADGAQLSGGLGELLIGFLPAGSAVPAYLRRLLLSGDTAGRTVFRRWYDASAAMLARLTEAGFMRASADPPVRAAFMLINDLAVVLLRDHLTDVLGVDPLGPDGLRRWSVEVAAAYTRGVFTTEA
ncbi:MAG TPA: TetR family transcriptional regulator [Micromonosporaceae bacterium]|jgi:AcrR family transcriptional regulator